MSDEQPLGVSADASSGRAGARLRASDAERAAVVDALQAHCADGRLTVQELEQRLAMTMSAMTVAELDRLTQDLPGSSSGRSAPPARTSGRVKVGPPGLRSFRQDHRLPAGRAVAFRQALQDILPAMVASGYDVVSRTENELLVFEHRRERVVVAFNDDPDGGTRLVVQGTARRAVRKAFANLAAE